MLSDSLQAMIARCKTLRSQGWSYSEISKEVSKSKTSIAHYVKGVEVLPEFKDLWAGKRGGSAKRRIKLENDSYKKGLLVANNITKREKLLFLSALYWAEGNKKDFILTNSDPSLIKAFLCCLEEVFLISKKQIKVSLRIYEDLNKEECLQFWSQIVNIPAKDFLSVHTLPGKKIGKLKYGMCRIRLVKGNTYLKIIGGLNKALCEVAFKNVPVAQVDRAPRS